MSFYERVVAAIEERHMLNSKFYKAWVNAELKKEHLAYYAAQYYPFILSEPVFLSAIHCNMPYIHTDEQVGDISDRQIVLENLVSEERGSENHPKLWKDFCYAMGVSDEQLRRAELLPTTQALIDFFRKTSLKEDFYLGLAALFAYEYQIPSVAKTKIEGLKSFYGVKDPADYLFFSVHEEADVWHSEAGWFLIEKYARSDEQKQQVLSVIQQTTEYLTNFLDGIHEYCQRNLLNV